MEKLSTVLVLVASTLVLFGMVSAQTSSPSVPEPSSTVSPGPTSTSPGPAPTSSLVPEPTETPAQPVPDRHFYLNDGNSSLICLNMTAAIVLNVSYTEEDNNMTKLFPVTEYNISMNGSTCDSKDSKATLYLSTSLNGSDADALNITLTFSGDNTTGNKHWNMSRITFNFTSTVLNYTLPEGENDTYTYVTADKLFDNSNSNIEFTRSYKCNSTQTLEFNSTHTSIKAELVISEFQVQAFQFKNTTSGVFDNARVCLLDNPNKGNKIVPIAVGAALAGLVVVVLIAYLVGRLRSRRQSSYEALS